MPDGKYFYITSKLNGLVLDIQGGNDEPGTPVIMWHKKDEGPVSNQVWMEDHINGCIRSSLKEDLCLAINDDNVLVVENFEGSDNDQWMTAGDRIQNRADSNRVLDILNVNGEEGATVGAWEYNGGENQLWEVEYLEARMFNIVSDMNGKLITCKDDKLKMYEKDGYGDDHQVWYEDKHGLLCCMKNEFVMTCKKGLGHKVKMDHFEEGQDCQMWCRSGKKIMNLVEPDWALDIKGEDDSDGAKVIAWEYNEQDNQHWTFDNL